MIRTNTLLAGLFGGALVSATCFTAAAALPDRPDIVTRELTWSGDALILGVPAEVHFTQSPGPAKLIVTGPRRSVEKISVRGGVVNDSRISTGARLMIELTAPSITRFDLKGGDKLIIDHFDQPKMTITMTGNAQVAAQGKAGSIKLRMQGASSADLGQIESDHADVTLQGASRAVIAPRESAKLGLTGFTTVILTTKPEQLETKLTDSARVIAVGAAASEKEHK